MSDERETLEWLCWCFATNGERFYPPDETAKECMGELYGDKEEWPPEKYGVEKGQHSRAWTEAVEFYHALQRRGFDPVEMAQAEIERSREEGLDLPDIDWAWLQESRYEFE